MMGLLNMGQGEGSQIIQLFGRGVRLKGKGFSLKRTLPQDRPKGVHLDKLETLNIFGVLGHHPKLLKRFNLMGGFLLNKGLLPERERELVILRTGSAIAAEVAMWGPLIKSLNLTAL